MIDIKVLSTGSKGNCYHISDGVTSLLIDCGISISATEKSVRLSNVDACLVTHRHKDHCLAVDKVADRGVAVYAPTDVYELFPDLRKDKKNIVNPLEQFTIGTWTIMPFDVEHDVPTVGYLMQSTNGAKLLHFTDTYYIKYTFSGVTHALVECNHDAQLLQHNVNNAVIHPSLARRIRKSHMSVQTLSEMFKVMDKRVLEEVHLIHRSSDNGDKEAFERIISGVVGLPVTVY